MKCLIYSRAYWSMGVKPKIHILRVKKKENGGCTYFTYVLWLPSDTSILDCRRTFTYRCMCKKHGYRLTVLCTGTHKDTDITLDHTDFFQIWMRSWPVTLSVKMAFAIRCRHTKWRTIRLCYSAWTAAMQKPLVLCLYSKASFARIKCYINAIWYWYSDMEML